MDSRINPLISQNYPWQCLICPAVGAIAAGCPAVLKVRGSLMTAWSWLKELVKQPSELAPASAALIAELIPKYLDPEAYAVVMGGVVQTTKLLEKEWGHSQYTSSFTRQMEED